MKCIKCQQDKDEQEFSLDKTRKSGRANWCKECHNVYSRNRYLKDEERQRKLYFKHKDIKAKHKEVVNKYLKEHPCIKCGNDDIRVLDFHHRNPKEKERGVSQLLLYRIEKIMEEISKCDVLCANCHRIEHLEHKTYKPSIFSCGVTDSIADFESVDLRLNRGRRTN